MFVIICPIFSTECALSSASFPISLATTATLCRVYLKPALVQCAHAAVKSDKSPYYKKKYESLVKRRGKKRAIIAIARMILTAIYQMLSTGEQWNPSDLYKIDMPVALVEKQKAKAIKQAKKLLQREGLLPPDEPLAS